MQVVDKGSNTPAPSQGLDLKKASVIAKLQAKINPPVQPAQQAQTEAVANPSQVSPEEMGAIMPSIADETGQKDTTETPAAEAAPEAPKAAEKAEEPLSAQYAQLARKERAMRAEAQKLKAEREALRAEQDALRKPAAPAIDESRFIDRSRFESDPLAALAEMGISYDSLTQRALNAPTPEQIESRQVISKLEAKIAELEGKVTGTQKTFEEQQANGYKQALAQIRNDVNALVKTGDTFEMIRSTQSSGDVVELIERTFKEGLDDDRPKGTLLSVEEAAGIVEEHLLEEALKLAKLNKIQAKLKPAAATPATPAKTAATDPNKQPQVKTLTNSISSSRQYSAKERALLAAQHGPDWRSKVS